MKLRTRARNEIQHAKLAFEIASDHAGHELTPGTLPLPDALRLARSEAEIAVAAAMEGCHNETIAAREALEASSTAQDPRVITVLKQLASDETRHAVLSGSPGQHEHTIVNGFSQRSSARADLVVPPSHVELEPSDQPRTNRGAR